MSQITEQSMRVIMGLMGVGLLIGLLLGSSIAVGICAVAYMLHR